MLPEMRGYMQHSMLTKAIAQRTWLTLVRKPKLISKKMNFLALVFWVNNNEKSDSSENKTTNRG